MHELFKIVLDLLVVEQKTRPVPFEQGDFVNVSKIFNKQEITQSVSNILFKLYSFGFKDSSNSNEISLLKEFAKLIIEKLNSPINEKRIARIASRLYSHIPICSLHQLSLDSKHDQQEFFGENANLELRELIEHLASYNFVGIINCLKRRNQTELVVLLYVKLFWKGLANSDLKSHFENGDIDQVGQLLILTKIVRAKSGISTFLLPLKAYLDQKVYSLNPLEVGQLFEKLKLKFVWTNIFSQNKYSNLDCPEFAQELLQVLRLSLETIVDSEKEIIYRDVESAIKILFNQNSFVSSYMAKPIPILFKSVVDQHEKVVLAIRNLINFFDAKSFDASQMVTKMTDVVLYLQQIERPESQENQSDSRFLSLPLLLLFNDILPFSFYSLSMKKEEFVHQSSLSKRANVLDVFTSFLLKIMQEVSKKSLDLSIDLKARTFEQSKDFVSFMKTFVHQLASKKILCSEDFILCLERSPKAENLTKDPIVISVAKSLDKDSFHQNYTMSVNELISGCEKSGEEFIDASSLTPIYAKIIRAMCKSSLKTKITSLLTFFDIEKSSNALDFRDFCLTLKESLNIEKSFNFLKRGEVFCQELNKILKTPSQNLSGAFPKQTSSKSSILDQLEVSTVYEIHIALLKLKIDIHPKDIFSLLIFSGLNYDSKGDGKLTFSETISIMKASLYQMIKTDLDVTRSKAPIFALIFYYGISTSQQIFTKITEHSMEVEFITLVMVLVGIVIWFVVLYRFFFGFDNDEFFEKVKARIQRVFKAKHQT